MESVYVFEGLIDFSLLRLLRQTRPCKKLGKNGDRNHAIHCGNDHDPPPDVRCSRAAQHLTGALQPRVVSLPEIVPMSMCDALQCFAPSTAIWILSGC
jgi:hypothetical protein